MVEGGLTEVLQAGPVLSAVSAATGTQLLLLCPPAGVSLAHSLEGADELVALDGLARRAGPVGFLRLWRALRRRRVDAVLLCTESAWVRAAAHLAGVPRRIGCRDGLSAVLLSDRVDCPHEENRARAWLALSGMFFAAPAAVTATVTPPESVTARAEQLLARSDIDDGRPLIAVAPGRGFGEDLGDPWPPERFAHLANRLATEHGAGIVILGDEGDTATAQALRIDLAVPSLDLCGEVDLVTAAAVLSRCRLLVSADTPLLHLAAAVGTPTVGLFSDTDGARRAPAGDKHRVVQAVAAGGGSGAAVRVRVDDMLDGVGDSLG